MTNRHDQLWSSLSDPEFRKQLIDEHVNVGIAFQIRALRKRQNLYQTDLAKLLGIKQPLVSSWEDPNYGRYALGTLKDLAEAFDVGLLVRFVPFSTLADWMIDLESDAIAPPNFTEEEKAHASTGKASTASSIDATVKDVEDFLSTAMPDPYKVKAMGDVNAAT